MNTSNKTRLILSLNLVLTLIVGVLIATATPADSAVSLRIEPSMVELTGNPGASGTQEITLGNDGSEPFAVNVTVESYRDAEGDWSAVEWLSVELAHVELERETSQKVVVSFAIPNGLQSGGRYARVSFTTVPSGSEGNVSAIAGKLSTVFLVNVEGEGELRQEAAIDWFGPVLEPDGRVGFRTLVRNAGNVHLIPSGSVSVTGADGNEIAMLEVPLPTPLLPERYTIMAAIGSLPLPEGEHFSATLSLDTGGEQPLEAASEFTVQAGMSILEIGACENLDRGPTVLVGLQNDGDLGLLPMVMMTITSETGQSVFAGTSPGQTLLQPGVTQEVVLGTIERLPSGDYDLAVRADYAMPSPGGLSALPPLESETTFMIGGLGGDPIPMCGIDS